MKSTPSGDRIWQCEAAQILERLGGPRDECSVVCKGSQQHAFHFTVGASSGARFVCGADKAMGRRRPFAFLQALVHSFEQRFTPQQVTDASPDGLQAVFAHEIHALMDEYSSLDEGRAAALTAKVQHIQEDLMYSLDQLAERSEKIEVLVDRSSLLADQSIAFKRQAVAFVPSVTWSRRKRILVGTTLAGVLVLMAWPLAGYALESQ